MKQILSFNLFEARYSTHFTDRVKERIQDLREVALDTKNKEEIESELESEIGPNWKNKLISSIISNTDSRILKKIKLENYNNDLNFGVPISFLYLSYKGKQYPIEITTYSSSAKDGEDKVYKGSQICVALGQDTAWTIKVFPKDKSRQYISDNLRDGVSDRFKGNSFSFVEPGPDYKSTFEWDPKKGKFITDEEEDEKNLVPVSSNIEKDFNLSPGRQIKYYSKLTDSLVKSEIIEVINKDTYKSEKTFKVKILKPDGSEAIKTLKPGDEIYLPLGPDNGWVKCKIADQLYTIDNRIPNPILRIIA
jgi:hypothetical protein